MGPKYRVMNGKVLLERDKQEEVSEGGLYVGTKTAPGASTIGTVIIAGEDLKMAPGTKIAFRRGYDVVVDDKALVVVNEEDILVVIN